MTAAGTSMQGTFGILLEAEREASSAGSTNISNSQRCSLGPPGTYSMRHQNSLHEQKRCLRPAEGKEAQCTAQVAYSRHSAVDVRGEGKGCFHVNVPCANGDAAIDLREMENTAGYVSC